MQELNEYLELPKTVALVGVARAIHQKYLAAPAGTPGTGRAAPIGVDKEVLATIDIQPTTLTSHLASPLTSHLASPLTSHLSPLTSPLSPPTPHLSQVLATIEEQLHGASAGAVPPRDIFTPVLSEVYGSLQKSAFKLFQQSPSFQPLLDLKAKEIKVDTVANYKLLQILGEGYEGKVLQARKKDCGCMYAVKVRACQVLIPLPLPGAYTPPPPGARQGHPRAALAAVAAPLQVRQ